ncbi:chromosome alignment-maintaining phosphoprotein 1-like [Erpetoichthys calabaricus]|uniref:chromosome alignment-maintaining phosphoprotein 1-like n=1 Tax=Erpetoichthys calabaricus TaxID=27687 RepID=UPI0010A07EA9|nr:chromosome alignment-maintaining phosphoprotein 1-like [Erpetoichthys calabaricus]
METSKQVLNITGHLQCAYCSYQCISNENFQIHIGTYHPVHCENVDIGRLGKVIFYQRSPKLFHCQMCFFTGKTYTSVYDHVIIRHSFSGSANNSMSKNKGKENEVPKVTPSGNQVALVKPEGDKMKVTSDPKEEKNDMESEFFCSTPAKFTPLNSTNDSELEISDLGSPDASKTENNLKRKRNDSNEEDNSQTEKEGDDSSAMLDDSSASLKMQAEPDEAKETAQDEEEEFLSKYIRRNVGRYYCKICNWRGKMKGFVLYHVSRKHNIPKPYACKECDKSFFLESLLNNHVNLHHKQGLYKCPYCNFESNFLRGIRKHLKHCNSQHGEVVEHETWESDEQMEDLN